MGRRLPVVGAENKWDGACPWLGRSLSVVGAENKWDGACPWLRHCRGAEGVDVGGGRRFEAAGGSHTVLAGEAELSGHRVP